LIEAMKSQTSQEQRKELDASAGETLKEEGATEARAWLAEQADGVVFNLGKDKTKPTIEKLYQMGAKTVTVSGFADGGRQTATVLVIELPDDLAARKKLFAWDNETQKKLAEEGDDDYEPAKDVGQKYLEVNFDNT